MIRELACWAAMACGILILLAGIAMPVPPWLLVVVGLTSITLVGLGLED